MKFNDDGGLITYQEGDDTFCLGYLFDSKDHGIYDANIGKVDVTPEQAQAHNKVYDQALVKGLENCPIGQGTHFYVKDGVVSTWLGTVIGKGTLKAGTKATYLLHLGGKVFKYRKYPNDNRVFLTRIK